MTEYDRYPGTLTALLIRDILKNHTDADHPMTRTALAQCPALRKLVADEVVAAGWDMESLRGSHPDLRIELL